MIIIWMACVSIINYTKCSFIQIIRLVLNFSPLLRHKIDYGTETKCSLQLLFKIKYISPLALKNYMLVNFIHSFWLISRHFYFSQQIKQINKLTDHMKTMNFLHKQPFWNPKAPNTLEGKRYSFCVIGPSYTFSRLTFSIMKAEF